MLQAHAEIDHLCKGRAPSSADVRQMHYLKAVLYESTRLDPCAPLITRCSLDSGEFLSDVCHFDISNAKTRHLFAGMPAHLPQVLC